MFARLTALVSSGSSVPFELGEAYDTAWGQWAHHRGTWKADGSDVSVFRISAHSKDDAKLTAARNGIKRLRGLRHPNILCFKDTAEMEDKGEAVLYLVTEPVTPLLDVLDTINVRGPERDQYIAFGLSQVVSAVAFLNNDCKLIHGNVCLSSVVVTPTLDWRLHAFDLTTEASLPGGPGAELPLAAAGFLVPPQYQPAELARSEWQVVRDGPPYAIDSWGLGCLVAEVYGGKALSRTEDLRSTDALPKDVLQYYQRLLASAPARRLDPSRLAEASWLRNKLVETAGFLDNLALKDAAEKDAFFKRLPAVVERVPVPVAQRKLMPALAKALEYGGAPPSALGTLLRIGETLPEEERAKQVVPIVARLFASTDRGIRRGLLENLASFGPSLPAALVESEVYGHVAGGFADANPYLRELTLKSMVVLGPKLSQKTLTQSLLKHLAKLQVDEEPSIRANTTVLLGALAPHLGETTCRKVLLNAFGRAIRDAFPPARAAGVKAILATEQYHSAEDAAQRILPAVGPLCVDPVGEVRSSALACVDRYTALLRENSAELDRKAKEAAAKGDATAAAGTSAAAGGGGGGLLTSFGWAVSSLGLSRGAGGAAELPKPAAPVTAAQPPAAAAAPAQRGALAAAPPEASGADGWGDDDEPLEAMMADLDAEMEARRRLSSMSTGRSAGGDAARSARPPPQRGVAGRLAGDVGERLAPRRPPAAKAPRRPAAAAGSGGGGMKLGAKKKDVPEDDFSEW